MEYPVAISNMNAILGITVENLIIGLLGGFTVSLFFLIVTLIKNKILERRYPIKGTYLTTFEDLENGETVSTHALAVLTQRGKKIKGKTFLTDNRTWVIDGKLTTGGNLHGVYSAEDPMDQGVGTFFLKITPNKGMFGLWSGFDSVNSIVNSGKYSFIPILEGYTVSDTKKEHITQIVAVGNGELGEGFLNYQEIADKAIGNESYICKVATHGNAVIGFCLCKIVKKDDLCTYLGVDQQRLPVFINCADRIGVIKTIAVSNAFQKRGVGYALCYASYNELVNQNIQAVMSIAWKSNGRINANGVLSAVGLKPHTEIESFWSEDSWNNNYACPSCGEPPCKCNAILYFKAV